MDKERTEPAEARDPARALRLTKLAGCQKKKLLRTAAYCRVSTENEDQDGSIEIQKEHFAALIASRPDWENAGLYYERVSGTHREKRPELGRLLHDCRKGKIDLVIFHTSLRLRLCIPLLPELHSRGWLHLPHRKP